MLTNVRFIESVTGVCFGYFFASRHPANMLHHECILKNTNFFFLLNSFKSATGKVTVINVYIGQ